MRAAAETRMRRRRRAARGAPPSLRSPSAAPLAQAGDSEWYATGATSDEASERRATGQEGDE